MIELVRASEFPAEGYMPFSVQKRLDISQFDVPLTPEQQKLLKRLNRMLSLPKAGRLLRENLEMIAELLRILQAESPTLSGPLPPRAERQPRYEESAFEAKWLGWISVAFFAGFTYFVAVPQFSTDVFRGWIALIAGVLMSFLIFKLTKSRV